MEKLTIARLGQTKDVNTKFGMKKKTGVIFQEYDGIWHDIWSGDLKEGQVVEGTRESREYQGKTYWSFNFPKKSAQASPEISEKLERLLVGQTQIKLSLRQIYDEMEKRVRTKEEKLADYPMLSAEDIPDGDVPF